MTNRLLVRARVDDCVKQDRCEQEPDDVAADSQRYMLVWTLQLRRTITQDVLDEKNGDRVDSNSHTDRRSRSLNNIRSMKTQCIVQHPCQHSKPETCGFSEAQKAQESDSTPDPQPITIAEKVKGDADNVCLIIAGRFYRSRKMVILHCRSMRQSQTFLCAT